MDVAVAWNGPDGRVVHRRGTRNQEHMPAEVVESVAQALRRGGHDARVVEGDVGLLERLDELGRAGMVFNLCYGVQGAARYTHVPGLLEMAGIPYTGSDPIGHAVALEKPVAKALFHARGLPTPDSYVVPVGQDATVKLPFPVVVKPVRESTSLGIALARDREQLREAVANIHATFQEDALVEAFVEGTDLFVPILGNLQREVLPIVQVDTDQEMPLLTHADKEDHERELEIRCPAQLPDGLRTQVERIATAACDAVGVRDWARVDLRMRPQGDVQILEVNTLPGLGRLGSFPIAARAAGLSFDDLVLRILEHASQRTDVRPERALEATR